MIGEFIEISNGIDKTTSFTIGNVPEISFKGNITKYKATIVARNREVCNIEGSIEKDNYETVANFGGDIYTIKSFGQNSTFGQVKAVVGVIGNIINNSVGDAISSVLPQIYDQSGNMIGKCEVLWSGTGTNKYPCMKYIINNTNLYAYQLAPKAAEMLYCIYNDQEQMVATISRARKISNGHARYTIYSANEEWFKYVSLITICWSLEHTEEDGTVGSYSSRSYSTLTPELLEKYNPTFIDQVKQKEGINNLPENMQLVNEKVKESKNADDVKFYKIILVAFIIAVVMLVLFNLK